MIPLTLDEIEDFIEKMKNGKTLILSGEYDPDPYGGGANWNFEIQYNFEKQIFVLKTNFYPSQYNTEPEVSCNYLDEEQTIQYLLHQNKNKLFYQ
jgi:hypothetical protein